jgi:predicted PurR-regulated permease PerM
VNQSRLDDRRDFGRRVLRASAVAVAVVLGALLVVVEGRVLMVLLAGVLFALALGGTSRWTSRVTHLPYGATLATLAVLLVASLALGTYFLGAGIAEQTEAFAREIPKAWSALLDAIRHRPALAQVIGPVEGKAPTLAPDTAHIVTGASGAFEAIGALVVVFFIGAYGAAQPEAYQNVVLQLVPSEHRAHARSVLHDLGGQLTRWLAGRAVAMALVGALVTIGLLALKVPLAVPLGLLAGILTFIEYLGAFASAAPAILLAFTRGPSYAIETAILFTVAHIIEGYLLTPLLVRTTVKFPPGYTLGAQVLLGAVFGVAGLTFATPVMITATVLVRDLYVEPRGQREKRDATHRSM